MQTAGNSIVIADGKTQIEAAGNAVILVNSPDVKINLRSPDAKVIFMNGEAHKAQITRDSKLKGGEQQVVTVNSPLALEKTMELALREAAHREPGSTHYPDSGGNGTGRGTRAVAEHPSRASEEATRIARKLLEAGSAGRRP